MVTLVVGVAAVAWTAGRQVSSPAERAAKRRPPGRTVLTEAVVEQRVAQDVALRVRSSPVSRVSIATAPDVEGALPVVTAGAPGIGSTVVEGQRLVEVSGRPLVVLGGAIKAYRDLKPGDRGPDVRQAEEALRRLGLLGGEPDDVYRFDTKVAIRALYERAGSSAVEFAPDGEAEADLRRTVQDAQVAEETARSGGDPTAFASASRDLATAAADLDRFLAASGPVLRRSEVVFVAGLPLYVGSTKVVVGSELPAGAYLTLRTAAVTFRGSVTPAIASPLRSGQRASISADDGEATVEATLESVGVAPAKDGTIPVVFVPGGAVASGLLDREVKAVVRVREQAHASLAVPVSALVTRTDGTIVVVRRDARDRSVVVPVRVGLEAGGLTEVIPLRGRLRVGDRVVIGS